MHFQAFDGVAEPPQTRSEGCVFYFGIMSTGEYHLMKSSELIKDRVLGFASSDPITSCFLMLFFGIPELSEYRYSVVRRTNI